MQKANPPRVASLNQYSISIGEEMIDNLRSAASPLKGKKIVEINATAVGGGVAELLSSQIPLCNELGLDVSWYVLPPDDRFFKTTKGLHNCLQGECALDQALDFKYYQQYLSKVAETLPEADLYVLHDPQTLGLVPFLKHKPLVWRCHIDLTEADPSSFEWLQGYYQHFKRVIFSLDAYVHGLDNSKVSIVHPAIDPLSPKNIKLSETETEKHLLKHNLSSKTPYILQVSRFDKFKDPIGVIKLYEQLKPTNPDLRCILIGNYATDDPEGLEYYNITEAKAREVAGGGVDIIVDASDMEVNAIQQNALVVIQNSTREGFGLTVTEAMWKKRVVFSRPVGGIALQIIHDKTGYYLSNNQLANVALLNEVIKRRYIFNHLGDEAHQHVKQNFVTPKMLTDYLNVYLEALKKS